MIILIPAFEPDSRLVALVAAIRSVAPAVRVVVVDDGSGPSYRVVLDAVRATPGCVVLGHPVNRGKGFALRSGFRYIAATHPGEDVVCADCDGQHSVVDILRVAGVVGTTQAMVLGTRRFTGAVPARSRVGNAVTRVLFRLATGCSVRDTQTGLRGYPAATLDWLCSVRGDRFEYELNLLLRAARDHRPMEEVEIATIYLEENASSHFRPVVDSVRIYTPLLRFSLSSLVAFGLDTLALLVLHAATGALLPSVLGARALSSAVNFVTNRRLVFERSERRLGSAALRYWGLAVALLGAGYGVLSALTGAGVGLLPAKVVTEVVLFLASYHVQARLVFAAPRTPADVGPPERLRTRASQEAHSGRAGMPQGARAR